MPNDHFMPSKSKIRRPIKVKKLKSFQKDVPEVWLEIWSENSFNQITVYLRNLDTGEIRKLYENSASKLQF
jgi:predicted nucleotidyltransferase